MAHRMNNASRANRQLCRLNRAPVLAAELSAICADSNVNATPKVTVALGDLVHSENITLLGNPSMRATLARAMAAFYKSQKPSLTAIQVKALMYSEMTMSCLGDATGTVAEMNAMRDTLKAILRSRPPTDAEVQAVFIGCWNKITALDDNSRYRIADTPGLVEARPEYEGIEEVNQRIYHAWAHGCGVFAPSMVRPATASAAWALVSEIAYPPRQVVACPMTLSEADKAALLINYEEFVTKWRTAQLEFFCGYYDAQAWVEKSTVEKDIVHALFTCLAHLSKGQNKTTSWINSRFRRVQEHITGLGDLDAAVVQEFSRMHGGMRLTSDQIFAALAAAYKCLSDTPAASLCWVIEQSVASNITGALIVADIISKLQFFPLSTLVGKVIPEIEFKALVRLAMHTIINKFGSLAGPTVTVKEYADIAHLAMSIHKRNARGAERNSLIDYAGEYTQYLKLNKNDLEAMAANIQAVSAGSAASSVSLANLIRADMGHGAIIAEMDGESMVFEDMGPSEALVDDERIPQPQGAVPLNNLPQELRRHKRYYRAKNVQTILSELRERESDKIRAFRDIMGELSTCGVQSSAYFSEILATKYQLPYTTMHSDLEEKCRLWLGEEVDRYLADHLTRSLNAAVPEGRLTTEQTRLPSYFTDYVRNVGVAEEGGQA